MLPADNPMKLVAVLNQQLPSGVALNALGHMAFGLAGLIGKSQGIETMRLLDYIDKDGSIHPSICYYPFIVLRAGPNQLRALRQEAIAGQVPFVDFLDTMTIGTSEAQVAKTKETSDANLVYFGICLYAEKSRIDPLTRKFSLWKD